MIKISGKPLFPPRTWKVVLTLMGSPRRDRVEIRRDGELKIINAGEVDITAEWNEDNDWLDIAVLNVPTGYLVQVLYCDDVKGADSSSSWWTPLGDPQMPDEFGWARFKDADQPGKFRAYRAKLISQ